MRPVTPLLALVVLLSSPAGADDVVLNAASIEELGRFEVAKAGDNTVIKVDTMTGTTWYLCSTSGARKGRPQWCRSKDKATFPPGPVGRYSVTATIPVMMLDTVSGRTWVRCDDPTADRAFSWCPLDD